MLGVYIHIPFCKRICSYCDFCKVLYNDIYIDKYLDSLYKEIKNRYKGELVDTIYIGGGTPNSLSIEYLDKLFNIIKIFKLKDKYEFTIECNIEFINEDSLRLFKENGVNRLSIGIESFNKDNIKILGRGHNKEIAIKNIELCKKYFDNINIDIIYGIDEDIEKLKEDLNIFRKLDLTHISCYSLILEEHTKLYIDKKKYINEEIDRSMYDYIEFFLEDNGYKHYEISNYSKVGYESFHNKIYWKNIEYYGFGLGAVSYIDNYRICNTKNLSKYIEGDYILSKDYEDRVLRMENELMLGLRLINGISISLFNKKYNCDIINIECIKKLIKDKYLVIDKDNIKIDKKYLYVSNSIIESILGGLDEESN